MWKWNPSNDRIRWSPAASALWVCLTEVAPNWIPQTLKKILICSCDLVMIYWWHDSNCYCHYLKNVELILFSKDMRIFQWMLDCKLHVIHSNTSLVHWHQPNISPFQRSCLRTLQFVFVFKGQRGLVAGYWPILESKGISGEKYHSALLLTHRPLGGFDEILDEWFSN